MADVARAALQPRPGAVGHAPVDDREDLAEGAVDARRAWDEAGVAFHEPSGVARGLGGAVERREPAASTGIPLLASVRARSASRTASAVSSSSAVGVPSTGTPISARARPSAAGDVSSSTSFSMSRVLTNACTQAKRLGRRRAVPGIDDHRVSISHRHLQKLFATVAACDGS